ncbi:MAG TPA: hypothetical protein VMH02_04395 [Verrucomicrobiae bacterium]|nr:hypothetical protein [Verrucomicrobiae bacterium]
MTVIEAGATAHDLDSLADSLTELRQSVARAGLGRFRSWRKRLTRRSFRASGLNLAAYVAGLG